MHREVGAYARERGIETLCSPWARPPAPPRGLRRRAALADVDALNIAALGGLPPAASVLVKGSRFMQHGAGRRGDRRIRRATRTSSECGACCLAWPSGCRRLARVRLLPRVPVHHVPRGDGGVTSLLIGLVFGPWVIRRLTALKIGQPCARYGSESHLAKSGTPTMGGVLILIAIGVSTLLWFDWSQPLRLDRAGGDLRFRRDRLGRRLAQGRAARTPKACVAREVLLAVADRPASRRSISRSACRRPEPRVLALFLRWVAERLLDSTCRPRPT